MNTIFSNQCFDWFMHELPASSLIINIQVSYTAILGGCVTSSLTKNTQEDIKFWMCRAIVGYSQ